MKHSLYKSVATLFLYHPRFKTLCIIFNSNKENLQAFLGWSRDPSKSKLPRGLYLRRYDKMCNVLSHSETYEIVCSNEAGKKDVYQFRILLQIIKCKVVAAGSSVMVGLKLHVCFISVRPFSSKLIRYSSQIWNLSCNYFFAAGEWF